MQKNWIVFLIILFLALQYYNYQTQKERAKAKQLEDQKKKEMIASGQIPPDDKATSATAETAKTSSEAESKDEPKSDRKEQAEADILELDREETKIEVTTKHSRLVFTDRGGRPTMWNNIDEKYFAEMEDGKKYPVELISQDYTDPERELPLEINFRESNSRNYSEFNRIFYTYKQSENDKGDTVIEFTSPTVNDLQLVKTYTIPNDKFYIEFQVKLINHSDSDIKIEDGDKGITISWGPGFGDISKLTKYEKGFYNGFSNHESGFLSSSPSEEKDVDISKPTFWGGMENKYFFSAIFPAKPDNTEKRSFINTKALIRKKNILDKLKETKNESTPVTMEFSESKTVLSTSSPLTYNYTIYGAPKDYTMLRGEKLPVEKVLFHSSWDWMRWLCLILLKLLGWFHSFVNNYGIAIIMLTIFTKVITHPLTHKGMKLQAKAMAEQARIKPYVDEIQAKYKNNPQKRNAEMMKLYKEHGINPFGMLRGCVPMMIQMPIFFALYKVFNQSIDLRNQTFLWIKDLSMPDALFMFPAALPLIGKSFNLLPILMAVSQFFVSRITSTNIKDPAQRQMMVMMPVMFMFILYSFPSGLVLYWLIQNLWQFAHQFITNKIIKKEDDEHHPGQAKA